MPPRLRQVGMTATVCALVAWIALLATACRDGSSRATSATATVPSAVPSLAVSSTVPTGAPRPTAPPSPTPSERAGFLPVAQQDPTLIAAIRRYVEAGGGDYKGDCLLILSLISAQIDPGARYCSFVRPPRGDTAVVVLLDLSESAGVARVTFQRRDGTWAPMAVPP